MKRQLQIKNGLAQSEWRGSGGMPVPPDGSWTFLDVTDQPEAQVGMTYDPATDTFTPPPAPPDYGAAVDVRAFLLRFTAVERKAARVLARTDEDVADFLALAQVPIPIRLRHPVTLAGLDLLVARGVITARRKGEITAP